MRNPRKRKIKNYLVLLSLVLLQSVFSLSREREGSYSYQLSSSSIDRDCKPFVLF